MQREKLYNLQRTSHFIYMHLLFLKYAKFSATKKWSFSQSRKLVAQTFNDLENKKRIYEIKFLM